tara:strand:- start:5698 stop:6612 length:915 start_codon:yes stop_codon:yes gene_type:complete
MSKKPLVSILMNCFNGEEFLNQSLNSVINQSYKNWELIFWDNKSTDKSIEIVTSYVDKRIKIFKNSLHTNLGKARKNAFLHAKGDYLAFLDVDDIWMKDKLYYQIKEFNDSNIGISFTNSLYFSRKTKINLYKNKKIFALNTNSLIINYPLSLNSIMLDMKKIKQLDYDFDESFSNISDYDLIIRLSSISKVKYLNKVLSGWRIHGSNQSFKKKELFNQEREKWCNFHLKNNYLDYYFDEIKEVKQLILAEKRIFNYGLKNFEDFDLSSIRNFRNRFFIFFSFIPFIPNLIYQIKDLLFKFRWY